MFRLLGSDFCSEYKHGPRYVNYSGAVARLLRPAAQTLGTIESHPEIRWFRQRDDVFRQPPVEILR